MNSSVSDFENLLRRLDLNMDTRGLAQRFEEQLQRGPVTVGYTLNKTNKVVLGLLFLTIFYIIWIFLPKGAFATSGLVTEFDIQANIRVIYTAIGCGVVLLIFIVATIYRYLSSHNKYIVHREGIQRLNTPLIWKFSDITSVSIHVPTIFISRDNRYFRIEGLFIFNEQPLTLKALENFSPTHPFVASYESQIPEFLCWLMYKYQIHSHFKYTLDKGQRLLSITQQA